MNKTRSLYRGRYRGKKKYFSLKRELASSLHEASNPPRLPLPHCIRLGWGAESGALCKHAVGAAPPLGLGWGAKRLCKGGRQLAGLGPHSWPALHPGEASPTQKCTHFLGNSLLKHLRGAILGEGFPREPSPPAPTKMAAGRRWFSNPASPSRGLRCPSSSTRVGCKIKSQAPPNQIWLQEAPAPPPLALPGSSFFF